MLSKSATRFAIILVVVLVVAVGATITIVQSREDDDMINTTTLEANKTLVRAFGDAENSRDYDALNDVVAEDFSRHSAATPEVAVSSREDLKMFFALNAATFSDYVNTIEMIVAEDDMVAVYATFAGTMDGPMGDIPPTGNTVEMPFMALFRIEDGLIAELWVEWDNIGFLSQLGLFHTTSPAKQLIVVQTTPILMHIRRLHQNW